MSDSLQDIFLQRVEMFSSTTKSKKIEVKGGFYSESDMKTELGYSVMPSCKYSQWEFQDPKLEVLYHKRPYFLGISFYIGHIYIINYIW